jgi:hypothetical protein
MWIGLGPLLDQDFNRSDGLGHRGEPRRQESAAFADSLQVEGYSQSWALTGLARSEPDRTARDPRRAAWDLHDRIRPNGELWSVSDLARVPASWR